MYCVYLRLSSVLKVWPSVPVRQNENEQPTVKYIATPYVAGISEII